MLFSMHQCFREWWREETTSKTLSHIHESIITPAPGPQRLLNTLYLRRFPSLTCCNGDNWSQLAPTGCIRYVFVLMSGSVDSTQDYSVQWHLRCLCVRVKLIMSLGCSMTRILNVQINKGLVYMHRSLPKFTVWLRCHQQVGHKKLSHHIYNMYVYF